MMYICSNCVLSRKRQLEPDLTFVTGSSWSRPFFGFVYLPSFEASYKPVKTIADLSTEPNIDLGIVHEYTQPERVFHVAARRL